MAKLERKLWERIFILDNRIVLNPEDYKIDYPIRIKPGDDRENIYYADGLYTDDIPEQSENGWWGCSLTVNFVVEGNTTVNPEILFRNFGIGFYKFTKDDNRLMPMMVSDNKCSVTIYAAFEKALKDDDTKDKNFTLIKRRLDKHRRIKILTTVTNHLVENRFLMDTWYSSIEIRRLVKVKEKFGICKGIKKDYIKEINQDVIDRVKMGISVLDYRQDDLSVFDGDECVDWTLWVEEHVEYTTDLFWVFHLHILIKDTRDILDTKWAAIVNGAKLENKNDPHDVYMYYYPNTCGCCYDPWDTFRLEKRGNYCYDIIIGFTVETIDDEKLNSDHFDDIVEEFHNNKYNFSSGFLVENSIAYSLLNIEGEIDFSKERQDIKNVKITEVKSGLLKQNSDD